MQDRKSVSSIDSLTNVFAALVLAFSSLGVTPADAAILIVTTSVDSGPGSIRQAITLAAPGDTINFDASLSGATIRVNNSLVINKTLTIDGSALASKITISGDTDGNGTGDVTVVSIPGGGSGVTLDSLIITKGQSPNGGYGGGISNLGHLDLINVTLSGNSAVYGGGISNAAEGAVVTLSKCLLSGNSASGNSLGFGGGIYNYRGSVTITNSTLSGNSATGSGGGVFNDDRGVLSITNSTISGNTTVGSGGGVFRAGGGIFNNGPGFFSTPPSLTITNSTISGNSAADDGGGIYNGGVANVYNASIVFNVADADADINGGRAGGVFNGAAWDFNIRNTLIAGNSVGGVPIYDDCGGTLNSYGLNLIGAWDTQTSGSCAIVIVQGTRTFLNDLNLLGILQNNGGPTKTVALLPGSNAIDGADPVLGCTDMNGAGIFVDQRGVVRPKGVRCDVGAYELAPDTDGDGLPGELDNCTLVANPTQLDADADGYGNLCDGDLNNTGLVTAQDNTILRNVLNQPASASPTAAAADLNGSGLVTAQDNTILRNRLNTAPGPSGLACAGTIPCP